MKKMKAALETIEAELAAANEALAGYKTKEAEMMKKEKKMKRMASLMEAGIDNDTAASTVDKFESLDDEAFAAMTSLFAGKMPPWLKDKEEETKEEDKKEKKKASEAEAADPSILETAEVEEEVNLGVGGEADSSVENTRAALVEFVYSRLGKTLKN